MSYECDVVPHLADKHCDPCPRYCAEVKEMAEAAHAVGAKAGEFEQHGTMGQGRLDVENGVCL